MTLVPASPRLALLLVALGSAALLGGALLFQEFGGLPPCPMCIWQRWPHGVAIALGLLGALTLAGRPAQARGALLLVALAVAVSGAIGVFHAGVEYRLWTGPTDCSGAASGGSLDSLRAQLMAQTRVVRCDEVPWALFGISLAGWNALFSFALAGFALLAARASAGDRRP